MGVLRRALLILYTFLVALALFCFVTPYTLPGFVLPATTVTMLIFALLHARGRYGWRRALLFWAWTTGVTLLLESIGVVTGWVYGPYHYTTRLGPRFLGLVPYQIPMAWFMALYPAMVVAERALPCAWSTRRKRWALPVVAGLTMTAWDLVMDPLMVAGKHWVWEVAGAYFGIPLQNFLGWWVTVIIVVAGFLLWGGGRMAADPPPDREAVLAYALIGLGNVAHALALGYPGPALVGFFALFPWVWIGWWGAACEEKR